MRAAAGLTGNPAVPADTRSDLTADPLQMTAIPAPKRVGTPSIHWTSLRRGTEYPCIAVINLAVSPMLWQWIERTARPVHTFSRRGRGWRRGARAATPTICCSSAGRRVSEAAELRLNGMVQPSGRARARCRRSRRTICGTLARVWLSVPARMSLRCRGCWATRTRASRCGSTRICSTAILMRWPSISTRRSRIVSKACPKHLRTVAASAGNLLSSCDDVSICLCPRGDLNPHAR